MNINNFNFVFTIFDFCMDTRVWFFCTIVFLLTQFRKRLCCPMPSTWAPMTLTFTEAGASWWVLPLQYWVRPPSHCRLPGWFPAIGPERPLQHRMLTPPKPTKSLAYPFSRDKGKALQASAPVASKCSFLCMSSLEVLWVPARCPNPHWQLVGGAGLVQLLFRTAVLIRSHDLAPQLFCFILKMMDFLLPSSRTPNCLFHV